MPARKKTKKNTRKYRSTKKTKKIMKGGSDFDINDIKNDEGKDQFFYRINNDFFELIYEFDYDSKRPIVGGAETTAAPATTAAKLEVETEVTKIAIVLGQINISDFYNNENIIRDKLNFIEEAAAEEAPASEEAEEEAEEEATAATVTPASTEATATSTEAPTKIKKFLDEALETIKKQFRHQINKFTNGKSLEEHKNMIVEDIKDFIKNKLENSKADINTVLKKSRDFISLLEEYQVISYLNVFYKFINVNLMNEIVTDFLNDKNPNFLKALHSVENLINKPYINEYNNLINRLYHDNVKTLDGDNLDKYFKLTAGYPSFIFRDKEINFYYFRNFDIDRVGELEVVIDYKETKQTKKIGSRIGGRIGFIKYQQGDKVSHKKLINLHRETPKIADKFDNIEKSVENFRRTAVRNIQKYIKTEGRSRRGITSYLSEFFNISIKNILRNYQMSYLGGFGVDNNYTDSINTLSIKLSNCKEQFINYYIRNDYLADVDELKILMKNIQISQDKLYQDEFEELEEDEKEMFSVRAGKRRGIPNQKWWDKTIQRTIHFIKVMLILAFAVFNAASAIAAASEYVMVDGERHDVKSEDKFAGIKTLGISAIALGYAAVKLSDRPSTNDILKISFQNMYCRFMQLDMNLEIFYSLLIFYREQKKSIFNDPYLWKVYKEAVIALNTIVKQIRIDMMDFKGIIPEIHPDNYNVRFYDGVFSAYHNRYADKKYNVALNMLYQLCKNFSKSVAVIDLYEAQLNSKISALKILVDENCNEDALLLSDSKYAYMKQADDLLMVNGFYPDNYGSHPNNTSKLFNMFKERQSKERKYFVFQPCQISLKYLIDIVKEGTHKLLLDDTGILNTGKFTNISEFITCKTQTESIQLTDENIEYETFKENLKDILSRVKELAKEAYEPASKMSFFSGKKRKIGIREKQMSKLKKIIEDKKDFIDINKEHIYKLPKNVRLYLGIPKKIHYHPLKVTDLGGGGEPIAPDLDANLSSKQKLPRQNLKENIKTGIETLNKILEQFSSKPSEDENDSEKPSENLDSLIKNIEERIKEKIHETKATNNKESSETDNKVTKSNIFINGTINRINLAQKHYYLLDSECIEDKFLNNQLINNMIINALIDNIFIIFPRRGFTNALNDDILMRLYKIIEEYEYSLSDEYYLEHYHSYKLRTKIYKYLSEDKSSATGDNSKLNYLQTIINGLEKEKKNLQEKEKKNLQEKLKKIMSNTEKYVYDFFHIHHNDIVEEDKISKEDKFISFKELKRKIKNDFVIFLNNTDKKSLVDKINALIKKTEDNDILKLKFFVKKESKHLTTKENIEIVRGMQKKYFLNKFEFYMDSVGITNLDNKREKKFDDFYKHIVTNVNQLKSYKLEQIKEISPYYLILEIFGNIDTESKFLVDKEIKNILANMQYSKKFITIDKEQKKIYNAKVILNEEQSDSLMLRMHENTKKTLSSVGASVANYLTLGITSVIGSTVRILEGAQDRETTNDFDPLQETNIKRIVDLNLNYVKETEDVSFDNINIETLKKELEKFELDKMIKFKGIELHEIYNDNKVNNENIDCDDFRRQIIGGFIYTFKEAKVRDKTSKTKIVYKIDIFYKDEDEDEDEDENKKEHEDTLVRSFVYKPSSLTDSEYYISQIEYETDVLQQIVDILDGKTKDITKLLITLDNEKFFYKLEYDLLKKSKDSEQMAQHIESMKKYIKDFDLTYYRKECKYWSGAVPGEYITKYSEKSWKGNLEKIKSRMRCMLKDKLKVYKQKESESESESESNRNTILTYLMFKFNSHLNKKSSKFWVNNELRTRYENRSRFINEFNDIGLLDSSKKYNIKFHTLEPILSECIKQCTGEQCDTSRSGPPTPVSCSVDARNNDLDCKSNFSENFIKNKKEFDFTNIRNIQFRSSLFLADDQGTRKISPYNLGLKLTDKKKDLIKNLKNLNTDPDSIIEIFGSKELDGQNNTRSSDSLKFNLEYYQDEMNKFINILINEIANKEDPTCFNDNELKIYDYDGNEFPRIFLKILKKLYGKCLKEPETLGDITYGEEMVESIYDLYDDLIAFIENNEHEENIGYIYFTKEQSKENIKKDEEVKTFLGNNFENTNFKFINDQDLSECYLTEPFPWAKFCPLFITSITNPNDDHSLPITKMHDLFSENNKLINIVKGREYDDKSSFTSKLKKFIYDPQKFCFINTLFPAFNYIDIETEDETLYKKFKDLKNRKNRKNLIEQLRSLFKILIYCGLRLLSRKKFEEIVEGKMANETSGGSKKPKKTKRKKRKTSKRKTLKKRKYVRHYK